MSVNQKEQINTKLTVKKTGKGSRLIGYEKQIKKETYLFCDKSLFVSFFKIKIT